MKRSMPVPPPVASFNQDDDDSDEEDEDYAPPSAKARRIETDQKKDEVFSSVANSPALPTAPAGVAAAGVAQSELTVSATTTVVTRRRKTMGSCDS